MKKSIVLLLTIILGITCSQISASAQETVWTEPNAIVKATTTD